MRRFQYHRMTLFHGRRYLRLGVWSVSSRYDAEDHRDYDVNEYLDRIGHHGWEVVHVKETGSRLFGEPERWDVWLKREVDEQVNELSHVLPYTMPPTEVVDDAKHVPA